MKDKRPTRGAPPSRTRSGTVGPRVADEHRIWKPREHPRDGLPSVADIEQRQRAFLRVLEEVSTECAQLVDFSALVHELSPGLPVAMDLLDAARIVLALGDIRNTAAIVRDVRTYVDAAQKKPSLKKVLLAERVRDQADAGRRLVLAVEKIASPRLVEIRLRPDAAEAVTAPRPLDVAVEVAKKIAEELFFEPKWYGPILRRLPPDFPTESGVLAAAHGIVEFFVETHPSKALTAERARLLARRILRSFGCNPGSVTAIFGAEERMLRRKEKAREDRLLRTS